MNKYKNESEIFLLLLQCCMLPLSIFIAKKIGEKSVIRSFQNWVIENRWLKFYDRKKSMVFQLINWKWSMINFWLESLKQATHCLRTIMKRGQNETFTEKIVSSRNTVKTMLHYLFTSPSFMPESTSSIRAKNVF